MTKTGKEIAAIMVEYMQALELQKAAAESGNATLKQYHAQLVHRTKFWLAKALEVNILDLELV